MKTDLNHEQLTIIIERARKQRSIAAGEAIATGSRQGLLRLARAVDAFLHVLLMSPTVRH